MPDRFVMRGSPGLGAGCRRPRSGTDGAKTARGGCGLSGHCKSDRRHSVLTVAPRSSRCVAPCFLPQDSPPRQGEKYPKFTSHKRSRFCYLGQALC
ncbi:hypothetical protein ACFPRL_14625 [Pseudoclavibacter helvolus]